MKNEEIIPNLNDPNLFQNEQSPFLIQKPEETMKNPDSNILQTEKLVIQNPEEIVENWEILKPKHPDFQDKMVDKSFLSDTSGLGSGSVSTAGLTQDTGDGEVSSVFICPFCSKKYLSYVFAEKHIQNFHSISPEKFSQLGLEIKAIELPELK